MILQLFCVRYLSVLLNTFTMRSQPPDPKYVINIDVTIVTVRFIALDKEMHIVCYRKGMFLSWKTCHILVAFSFFCCFVFPSQLRDGST